MLSQNSPTASSIVLQCMHCTHLSIIQGISRKTRWNKHEQLGSVFLQGVQVQLLFFISLWQALKKREMAKPSHFCQAHIWTFWYFDAWVYSLMIGMIFWTWGCFQIVWLLHLTWTEHSEIPHKTSDDLRHLWTSLRYPLTPQQTPPRHIQTTQDA